MNSLSSSSGLISELEAISSLSIISEELVFKLIEIAQQEISPISDARGSEAYKRLALEQLIKAHFLKLFPELDVEGIVGGN